MPSTFTSYWGSSFHGVEIKWTNDILADPVTLTAEYTCNQYWNPLLYFDSALTEDAAIAASYGGTTTNDYLIDYTAVATGSVIEETVNIESRPVFLFQFFIAHPTTADVFDGFNGKAWASLMTGTGELIGTPVVTNPDIIV